MYQVERPSFRKHVATILNLCGYETKMHEILTGRSGMKHKIDIVAEKFEMPIEQVLLIKCKAKEESLCLRMDEVLLFYVQVLDTTADHGIIITTCEIPEDAVKFANYYRMRIIQGESMEEIKRAMFQGKVKEFSKVNI